MTLKPCDRLCHTSMHKNLVRGERIINCPDVAGGRQKAL